MWRAFFLSIGISLGIVGGECLVVDRAVLVVAAPKTHGESNHWGQPEATSSPRVIEPPEWAPWSLMSCGAVVMIYSFTIPRRVAG